MQAAIDTHQRVILRGRGALCRRPPQHCDDNANLELADLGKKRIDWANQSMKVLQIIRKEFIKNQPLKGMRISACLHVTAETANLVITLRDGGADVVLCASNPLSTQDDVAACLVRDYNIPVFAIKGEDNDTYYSHIMAALDHKPHITMDDGADLVTSLHTKRTGRARRTSSAAPKRPPPASSACAPWPRKACCATPSSPSTTPTPSTCSTTATAPGSPPSTASSAPPTSCSPDRSSSSPATAGAAADSPAAPAALGAEVIVTEIDPTKAIEAVMDGFRVMSMDEAAKLGDVFCTVTGNKSVLRQAALRSDEGRRHHLQLRPLQRRNRYPGAGEDVVVQAHHPQLRRGVLAERRPQASTCWAKAASSTWPRPKAIRRP